MVDPKDLKHLIDRLQSAGQSQERAKAASQLAEIADLLNDEHYKDAMHALNNALADPDPMVIMAAIDALSHFTRTRYEEAAPVNESAEPVAATCPVCGKPEFLVDPVACEEANCPYRR